MRKWGFKYLAVMLLVSTVMLSACGSGGGSSSGSSSGGTTTGGTTTVNQGVFLDAPVQGLQYSTPTRTGVTDSNGLFSYLPGETVTFSIGGITLGRATAGSIVTPFSVSSSTDNPDKAVNILRFLQVLDTDGNPANGITISDSINTLGTQYSTISFDQSKTEFETSADVLSLMGGAGRSISSITAGTALSNYQNSVTTYMDENNLGLTNATPIAGTGKVGTYGDFDVYHLGSNLPKNQIELITFSKFLSTAAIDIVMTLATPGFGDISTAFTRLMQYFGAFPVVTAIYVDSTGALASQLNTTTKSIHPIVFLQTPKIFNPLSHKIDLNIEASTSPIKDITGVEYTSIMPGIKISHTSLYSFVPSGTPLAYGSLSLTTTAMPKRLLKANSIYMLLPKGGAINGLHTNVSTRTGVYGEPLVDLNGALTYSQDSISGFTFTDPGRYFLNPTWGIVGILTVDGDAFFDVSTAPTGVTATTRKVPDTGQTTKYSTAFGDDSDYTVNPPSYTDNGDGTITDNVTTLMWQKCSAGQTNDARCSGTATTYNWYQASGTTDATSNPSGATNICGSLSLGGQTDWRLPNRFELMLIADSEVLRPAINSTYFPATALSYYWSATINASSTSSAWNVDFARGGAVSYGNKPYSLYVRCVRLGQ